MNVSGIMTKDANAQNQKKYGKPADQKRCKYYTLSIGYACFDCKHAIGEPTKCTCNKSPRFGTIISIAEPCKQFKLYIAPKKRADKPKNICRAKRCVWLNKCGGKIGTCFWGKCLMETSK